MLVTVERIMLNNVTVAIGGAFIIGLYGFLDTHDVA